MKSSSRLGPRSPLLSEFWLSVSIVLRMVSSNETAVLRSALGASPAVSRMPADRAQTGHQNHCRSAQPMSLMGQNPNPSRTLACPVPPAADIVGERGPLVNQALGAYRLSFEPFNWVDIVHAAPI